MPRTLALLIASSSLLAVPALAQDVGASREGICCGASCCLIDGNCRIEGQKEPGNPCNVCDPAESQFAWTAVSGCVPPDAGQPAGEPDAGTRAAAAAVDARSQAVTPARWACSGGWRRSRSWCGVAGGERWMMGSRA